MNLSISFWIYLGWENQTHCGLVSWKRALCNSENTEVKNRVVSCGDVKTSFQQNEWI
jgi:hypothetical protein